MGPVDKVGPGQLWFQPIVQGKDLRVAGGGKGSSHEWQTGSYHMGTQFRVLTNHVPLCQPCMSPSRSLAVRMRPSWPHSPRPWTTSLKMTWVWLPSQRWTVEMCCPVLQLRLPHPLRLPVPTQRGPRPPTLRWMSSHW